MLRTLADVSKTAASEFFDDNCPQMAAALSYFTVFSLPPLLVLVVMMTSLFVERERVEEGLLNELSAFLGPRAGEQIQVMLQEADRLGDEPLAWILTLGALLLGATAAFHQLQRALNSAWQVEVDSDRPLIVTLLLKRLLSLGMMLTVGFLLLVSLVLNAVVTWAGAFTRTLLSSGVSELVMGGVELASSLLLFTFLFAAIFVVLPDARIAWRDVWLGSFVTAALLMASKALIVAYLGRSDPGSSFGAAGSLAVVLIWIFVSANIFLFGAEFTEAWAASRGRAIEPERGAALDAEKLADSSASGPPD